MYFMPLKYSLILEFLKHKKSQKIEYYGALVYHNIFYGVIGNVWTVWQEKK